MSTFKSTQLILALVSAALIAMSSGTPAFAIIGGQIDGNQHPYVGAIDLRPTG